MLSPEEAQKIKNNPEWQALEEHINECIDALDHCSLITETEDYDKSARGRKYAVEILENILEPFLIDTTPNKHKRQHALKKLGLQ